MAIRFRKMCFNNCFTRHILLFPSRSKTNMLQQKMLSYAIKFVTVGMFKFLKIREFLAYSKFSNIPRQSRNDSYYFFKMYSTLECSHNTTRLPLYTDIHSFINVL